MKDWLLCKEPEYKEMDGIQRDILWNILTTEILMVQGPVRVSNPIETRSTDNGSKH